MKVLFIGGGAREDALAWNIHQVDPARRIFSIPGNAGRAEAHPEISLNLAKNMGDVARFAKEMDIDITIVGPEYPLSLGIGDFFRARGLKIFAPGRLASQLEWSKIYAKEFMRECGIPTAPFWVYDLKDTSEISAALAMANYPVVLKRDGLHAGKGVAVCKNFEQAQNFLETCKVQGDNALLMENFIKGEELSFIVITDGKNIIPLPLSRDHKLFEGKMTGGMGVISPVPGVGDDLYGKILKKIIYPTLEGLGRRKITFQGVLYAGLMIKDKEPYLLEYNTRFGDPETQAQVRRMDADLLEIIFKTLDGGLDTIRCDWDKRAAVCVVLASQGYPEKYQVGYPISGLEKIKFSHPDVIVFHAGTLRQDDQVVTAGGRVLGVTGIGEDQLAAATKVYEAIRSISFQGMSYMEKIGM